MNITKPIITEISNALPVSMADEWFGMATKDHFWMDWRFKIVAPQISHTKSTELKFLEIGCGNGVFRSQAEEFLNCKVDGCDLNRAALEMSEQGRGKLFLYNIYEKKEELKESYDVIFLMDVVEHIEDDLSFLSAAKFHLKKRGFLVINVPALPSLFSAYDVSAGHQRRYSKAMLRKLANDCGLKIEKKDKKTNLSLK